MIESRVRVLRASQDIAWVEPAEQSGCGACQAKSACAISGLGRFFSSRRQPVPVCAANAQPGEHLTLVMSESDFLKAGLLAYLIPSVLAVAGAAVATVSGAGDAWAVLGMLVGVAAGILLAARLGRPMPMATHTLPLTQPIPSNQGETP